jgi:electron transfer flavoprotein beta subunit
MHVVVCIKQVPDTQKVTGSAMKPDGTINRAALPAIFNPEDKCALEAALRVKDRFGGTVTVLTMGLPSACAILREALMCGADKAYLLTDRKAAGSDTLATSYILSKAVASLKPDMVFCGRQAIDGDTAQVGPQIAEKLDFAAVTYLTDLEMDGDFAIATRDIGTGIERDRVHLPALFTVSEAFGELRPANVKRIMKYKKAKAPAETGGEAPAGCVAMSEEIDYAVLEAAALFHDTGMCGGYALNETVDENGLTVYETDENGRYIMYAEDNLNFAEVRVFHSLNSGLYVLLNRMELPSPCRRTARIRSMKSLEPGCSRGKRSIKGMV